MDEPILSFRLPEAKEIEVVLIRLPDGTVVARTKDEVAAMEKGGLLKPEGG